MSREREQFFMYDDPHLGLKKTDPGELMFHLGNYLMALTNMQDFLPKDKRKGYLDVACGSGYGTEILGTFFEYSRGIDADPVAVAYANDMHTRSGTVFATWDGLHSYIAGLKFDFVTMLECIEHFQQESAASILHNVAQWMQPHGLLWLCTPVATTKDGKNPDNPWHVHEYQPGELKSVLKTFFDEAEIAVAGGRIIAVAKKPKG